MSRSRKEREQDWVKENGKNFVKVSFISLFFPVKSVKRSAEAHFELYKFQLKIKFEGGIWYTQALFNSIESAKKRNRLMRKRNDGE